jgi:SAM-dependent methyltransferase
MDEQSDLPAAERLLRLLRHLGIARAHFVQGTDEAAAHPEVVASLTHVMPGGGRAELLRALAVRGALAVPPLLVLSDGGPLAGGAPRVLAASPGATAVVLRDYAGTLWSDVVADRADEIGAALLAHLAEADRRAGLAPLRLPEGEGEVAGIAYRARGSGPPVLLFPLYLSPSQWEPIVPALAERYCTLALGGPFLGIVAALEERARGGYGVVVEVLIDMLAPPAGGAVLEVGCGSGALTRRLARRTGPETRIVALDVNAYMLREAAGLARREGLAERIAFRAGDAEALPFPDASFDAALTCTVLEEVDADRALAELARVVRPGGRVGVAVRADDVPYWDSLPLRPELRAKIIAQGTPGASEGGCDDASLYRRFRALGLADVQMGPRLAVDRPEAGMRGWQAGFEAASLAMLDAAEGAEWRTAAAQAEADGSYLWWEAYHCAVGTKP